MSISVHFCVDVKGSGCVAEEQLFSNWERYRPALLANKRLEGAIIIAAPGTEQVCFEDELPNPVLHLCFGAVPAILKGDPVTVAYFNQPGEIRIAVDGAVAHVSGDFLSSLQADRRELAVALFGCGRRFLDLLRKMPPDAAHYWERTLALFAEPEKAAEQALAG